MNPCGLCPALDDATPVGASRPTWVFLLLM